MFSIRYQKFDPSPFHTVDSTPTFSTHFFHVPFRRSLPTHFLPLPRLPTGHRMLKGKQFLDEVSCRGRDDSSRTRRWGSASSGRCLQVSRPSGWRTRSWVIAIESESSIIFLIYRAADDHPRLPLIGYLQDWRPLVKISPTDHIFMDKKQEREWCMDVFDIQGDGHAMVLFQRSRCAKTIIVHKDVLLGLFFINKQHEGLETGCQWNSQQVGSE
jgi:hypothetical protein